VHVLIIGAGVIGVSIADSLARRGAEVTVIDMRSAGRGASRASAGILAPYTEAHEHSPLLALGTRSLALFDAFVAGAADRGGRPVEYSRAGTLEVAFSGPDHDRLAASSQWLDRKGIEYQWLEPAALRDQEPSVSPSAIGALFVPQHGVVGVASLIAALVRSARFAGAVFESPVEAVGVAPRPDGVEVRAADRRYDADAVVIAGGSWTGRIRIAGVRPPPVRPVRGQLLHVEWPERARPTRVVWGPECYVVPWSDGSMLIGATVEDAGFVERTTLAGVAGLASAAIALLPDLERASIVEMRAGLRPAAPDGLPIVGALESSPRLCFATAHFRNGILLAPLTAELVTGVVLDGTVDPALAQIGPGRFAAQP
jgi:glycine oxidase